MKTIIVFALCLVACFARKPDAFVSQKFAEFVKTHNKQYSPAEFERRMEIFAESLDRIDALNAANDGATYGITQFADLTPEEFRRFPCGVDKISEFNSQRPDFVPVINQEPVDTVGLPASWDWTTKGAVTPIKNQGQCGSCWAFSTIGNIEGVNFLATQKLVGLSEEQEVSCSTTDYGCSGGWPFWAMSDMINSYGGRIDTESGYPYTSGNGANGQCEFNPSVVGTTIKSYKSYCTEQTAACQEQEVMSLLVNQGPLSACLDAGPMQYYTSGIQNPTDCDPNAIDHCITIVGYGTQNGQDFWKIKNSWGTGWGENGYYYLIRGTGACGINKVITVASV